MSTDQQPALADQLELAARIVREGLDWEWRTVSGEWTDDRPGPVTTCLFNGNLIRIKPFALPQPPAGRRWHRTDGWTKEMLPDGWRPLLYAEEAVRGDEYWHGAWRPVGSGIGSIRQDHLPTRTRRPLPPTARPWSKPSDVPGPVCWVKTDDDERLVLAVNTDGLVLASLITTSGSTPLRWREITAWRHSTDRRTWLACTTTDT